MSDLTVAVPVLGRPQRLEGVLEAFQGADVLFLPDEDDRPTMGALKALGASYSIAHRAEKFGVPTYETKVNHAFGVTSTPYLMYAADDVEPQGNWLERILQVMGDNQGVGLLATNDEAHHLVQKGKLATHGVVRRSYVERYGSASLDDAGPVFYEGYRHWGCDAEASYVARKRNAFHFDAKIRITHKRRHNIRRHGEDKVYKIGFEYADTDRALMRERCPGWPELVQ